MKPNDIDCYIVRFHDRDFMTIREIAKQMKRPFDYVFGRYVQCVANGMREYYLGQLSEAGKNPIDWSKEVDDDDS